MGKSTTSSKADTAVKLVLIFFISLLSFSVGTYVGKQVSDSDAHRASLEIDYGHEKIAKNENPQDASTAPISDEEVASLTEEYINNERNVASEESESTEHKHAEDSPTAPTSEDGYTHHSKLKAEGHEQASEHKDAPVMAEKHGTSAPTPAHAKKPAEKAKPMPAAERVANDKAPTASEKAKRTPSTMLPSVASTAIGKYTVQVASYATEDEAKAQAAVLNGKGYQAFYVSAKVNGKVWYRVSVGLFPDQKSATNYRTELLSTQTVSSAIVQKIVQ